MKMFNNTVLYTEKRRPGMVVLFAADGTEEIEAIAVYDFLKRGGVDVRTVGVPGKSVCMSHGLRVECDLAAVELASCGERIDGVILPGGMPGTLNLELSPIVLDAVRAAAKENRLTAAICAAPTILGHLGLLEGKNAVCYPGHEKHLKGAVLSSESVVSDGNVITAKGAGVALEFAAAILDYFRAYPDGDPQKLRTSCDVLRLIQYPV